MLKNLISYCSSNNSDTSISSSLRGRKKRLYAEEKINPSHGDDLKTGKWTLREHTNFVLGVIKHGNDWKEVEKMIQTRTCAQARSHSQKFFYKLKKMGAISEVIPPDIREVKKLHEVAQNMEKEKLKSLIKTLIKIHMQMENSEDLEEDEIFKELCENNNNWTVTEFRSASEFENNIQDGKFYYNAIYSYMNFCNEFMWKCDEEIKLFEIPKKIEKTKFNENLKSCYSSRK
jgi:SHAQKYF class myb-like DNA-binding protein